MYLPAHNARCSPRRPLPSPQENAFGWPPIRRCSPRPCASRKTAWWPATTPSPMTAEGSQLPASSTARAHYVKARVRVREYPDGALAAPCSTARDGLRATPRRGRRSATRSLTTASVSTVLRPRQGRCTRLAAGGGPSWRPSLTSGCARGVTEQRQVGTKKRPPRSNQETDHKEPERSPCRRHTLTHTTAPGRPRASEPAPASHPRKRTNDVHYQNRTS